MKEEGAEVVVIGPKVKTYTSKIGLPAKAEQDIHHVSPDDYNTLIIPGGYAPDICAEYPKWFHS